MTLDRFGHFGRSEIWNSSGGLRAVCGRTEWNNICCPE